MRTRGMLKVACLFALVALTPSPAFAAHVVENTAGPGEQSAQDNAQLEARASLLKLNEIIQSLSPDVGASRRLNQDGSFGDLIQNVVESIQSSNLENGNFGGSFDGNSGTNLLGVIGGNRDGLPSVSDILDSDMPFTTGAFLLDTKNATVPASLNNMLKTSNLSPEEAAALQVTAASFFLTSAICFTVFGGLAIGAFSGLLFTAGLGLITGPYGWGLTVRQTWNNVLSSRASPRENTNIWTSTLSKTADKINNLNTGSLKQELTGLRGQLGDMLNLLSAVQSRFT